MAKQGMKRPDEPREHLAIEDAPVPEIQGKAKSGKTRANPIIAGTDKVFHGEIPIPGVYPVIDTDLARDNVENDLTAADRQDL